MKMKDIWNAWYKRHFVWFFGIATILVCISTMDGKKAFVISLAMTFSLIIGLLLGAETFEEAIYEVKRRLL